MLARFERERGVRLRYGTYESNEEMLAKVMTGNSGWDVVFPTHSRLAPMARNGLIATLDHARLPSLKNLDARFQRPAWDPRLRWGVPYMWNATGIAYNRAQTADAARLGGSVESRAARPSDDAGRSRRRDRRLSAEARAIRSAPIDERQLQAAKAAAIAQKQLLRAYLNAEVRDQLVSGDVLAAQLWSTTAAQAIHAQRESRLRLSARRLSALLRLRCRSSRKRPLRTGARVSRIPSCARMWRPPMRAWRKRRLLTQRAQSHAPARPGTLSARRHLPPGRLAGSTALAGTALPGPLVDRNQIGLSFILLANHVRPVFLVFKTTGID